MTPLEATARSLFDAIALEMRFEGVTVGMAYGHRALKHSGAVVACLERETMVFFLPESRSERLEALAVDGAHTWSPSAMNAALHDWVVVPLESSARWLAWARAAVGAVA